MGTDTKGLEREGYYAGWLVVGRWLEQGGTLAELAHLPAERMVPEVEAAIADLLRGGWRRRRLARPRRRAPPSGRRYRRPVPNRRWTARWIGAVVG